MFRLSIVHEDERALVLCKPAGQPCIPGRGDIGEPLNIAAAAHIGGKAFVVHRLDLEASGLVVFAKDAQTHARLSLRFERRQVQKTYLAVVLGLLEGEGIIRGPIKEFGSGRMGVAALGKPSVTRYRLKRSLQEACLLEVSPETGRRHQIRVHLYSIKHPVLGDPLYGSKRPVGGLPRLMLHALELDFGLEDFPKLRAQAPADFEEALRGLKI